MGSVETSPRTTNETHSTLQERHPDWPKLNVSFYFAPHGNFEDMQGIVSKIKESDVFFYEDLGRSEAKAAYLNSPLLREGMMPLETLIDSSGAGQRQMRGSHGEALVRGLHDAQVVAATLDIGKDYDEERLSKEIIKAFQEPLPRRVSYDEALSRLNDNYENIAYLMDERELIMANNFESEIGKILDTYPELKQKDGLNVLISMGVLHTRLRHAFTERGIPSDRNFSTGRSYTFGYAHELMRTFAYGNEPSKELTERAFAESIVRKALSKVTRDKSIAYDERAAYLRRYVSELSSDEMMDVFDLWNNSRASVDDIDNLLVPAGMPPLARSAEEIIETNRLYEDRVKTLASAALQASNY